MEPEAVKLPPEVIAKYDQAHQGAAIALNELVETHRQNCIGESARMVSVIAMSRYLRSVDPDQLPPLLAVAVDRLAAMKDE